jgi:hypothetical protein
MPSQERGGKGSSYRAVEGRCASGFSSTVSLPPCLFFCIGTALARSQAHVHTIPCSTSAACLTVRGNVPIWRHTSLHSEQRATTLGATPVLSVPLANSQYDTLALSCRALYTNGALSQEPSNHSLKQEIIVSTLGLIKIPGKTCT